MFSSLKRVIVGAAAVIGFASSANAAYIPDSWSQTIGGTHYVAAGGSYSYTHDITIAGFNPGTDRVDGFNLSIDLFDDQRSDSYEVAYVDIGSLLGLGGWVFDIAQDFSGWSLAGRAELNDYGTLSVTISSVCSWLTGCGDFVVGTSTLDAWGVSQVPEPGTIALLGLGLLGVGLGRRRKLAK